MGQRQSDFKLSRSTKIDRKETMVASSLRGQSGLSSLDKFGWEAVVMHLCGGMTAEQARRRAGV